MRGVIPRPTRSLDGAPPPPPAGPAVLRLGVRNGFAVGITYGPDQSTQLGTGQPTHGVFDDALREAALLEGPKGLLVFETAEHPIHMWHPGPGSHHYRVLWRRE